MYAARRGHENVVEILLANKASPNIQDNDGKTAENTTDEVPDEPTTDNESTTDEEPGDAAPIDGGNSDIHEERPISQSDLLVERDGVNTVMDEYVEAL